jgi:hypothetical protein
LLVSAYVDDDDEPNIDGADGNDGNEKPLGVAVAVVAVDDEDDDVVGTPKGDSSLPVDVGGDDEI